MLALYAVGVAVAVGSLCVTGVILRDHRVLRIREFLNAPHVPTYTKVSDQT